MNRRRAAELAGSARPVREDEAADQLSAGQPPDAGKADCQVLRSARGRARGDSERGRRDPRRGRQSGPGDHLGRPRGTRIGRYHRGAPSQGGHQSEASQGDRWWPAQSEPSVSSERGTRTLHTQQNAGWTKVVSARCSRRPTGSFQGSPDRRKEKSPGSRSGRLRPHETRKVLSWGISGVKRPHRPTPCSANWPVSISDLLEATPGIEPGIAVLQIPRIRPGASAKVRFEIKNRNCRPLTCACGRRSPPGLGSKLGSGWASGPCQRSPTPTRTHPPRAPRWAPAPHQDPRLYGYRPLRR